MRSLMGFAARVCAATVIVGTALAGCGVPISSVSQDRISCGSAANPAAVRCFDAALRNCRAASITEIAMLVDTGTRDVFTIETGTSPCQVTEQSQRYVVTGGVHHGPVTSTQCSFVAAPAGEVELTCGGQDVLIPATQTGPCRPRPGITVCTRESV